MAIWGFVARNSRLPALLLAVFACAFAVHAAAATPPPSIFDLGGTWRNQEGKAFTWNQTHGRYVVLSMVYTSCTRSCPLITERMRSIERELSNVHRAQVVFILMSFDPKRDKPEVLARFADKHHLDKNSWQLLTPAGDEARLMAAALDFKYKELQSGDFSHSDQITLVAPTGQIIMQESDLTKAPKSIGDAIAKALGSRG